MSTPIQNLANAIVLQAAKDYIQAERDMKRRSRVRSACARKRNLEQFFRSGWYSLLTDTDPMMLIEKLKSRKEKRNGR